MNLSSVVAFFAFLTTATLFGAFAGLAHASPPMKSASSSPANAELAQWKSFFALVLPAAIQNFSSMKGGMNNIPFVETYAVTASFPDVVRDCDLDHGGHPGRTFWSLGCATPSYTRSRSEDLVRDISATLPASFVKGTDAQGNPVWRDSSITVSTLLVLDNDVAFTILVCHDVVPKGCES